MRFRWVRTQPPYLYVAVSPCRRVAAVEYHRRRKTDAFILGEEDRAAVVGEQLVREDVEVVRLVTTDTVSRKRLVVQTLEVRHSLG
jgi:hypothetical protein